MKSHTFLDTSRLELVCVCALAMFKEAGNDLVKYINIGKKYNHHGYQRFVAINVPGKVVEMSVIFSSN